MSALDHFSGTRTAAADLLRDARGPVDVAVSHGHASHIAEIGNAASPPVVATLLHRNTLPAAERARRKLEGIGWEILAAEIDLVAETARLELRSFSGRRVTLDARNGKASITREQDETYTTIVGRKSDALPVERVRTRLLGRISYKCGLGGAMRSVAQYLADNAPNGELSPAAARDALRPLLGGGS